MMFTFLMLFQFSYAIAALREEAVTLEATRADLQTQRRELKVDYTETLRFLDDASADIQAAKLRLNARGDARAIASLDRRAAQFARERAALLEKKENVDTRNLDVEIAAITTQLAELDASIRKLTP